MTGLCGWFGGGFSGAEANALIERMASRLSRPVDFVALHHATGSLGIAAVGIRGETDLHVAGDTVAAIVGTPRWSDEFSEIARRDGNAAALAAAFSRHGCKLFDGLGGHFAIFAADVARGTAIAAVDRIGVHRLCYAARETQPLVFGASTAAVREFPGMNGELSPQSVFDFLFFNKMPAPATIFADQKKLMAAQYLSREKGLTRCEWYWRMPFETTDRRSPSLLGQELRDIVQRAVARAHTSADWASVGAFLSGGLDSSTVVGMLARETNGATRAFSIGFAEPRYDERQYARVTARHFGVELIERVVTPEDLLDVIPRIVDAYDEPYANSSAVLVYCCASLARECGVSLMLAGDGGDEVFGGNSRYVHQKYFEIYGRLPAWLRRFVVEPALAAVPFGEQLPLFRKARSYVSKANMPLPERLQTGNFFTINPPARVLSGDLLASVDPLHPIRVMRLSYDRAHSDDFLQRLFALDMQLTLADDDLRKVFTMCEAAGVNVRFPLLDDEVLAFAARVPPEICIKGFNLRHFYKEAFRGVLADETLSKSKHGFGMPFEPWLAGVPALRDLVNESLGRLKRRGLLNARFLDDVASGSVPEIEAHSHDVHWALMLLELWLERHVDQGVLTSRPSGLK